MTNEEETIAALYRALLGRNADPQGFADNMRLLQDAGIEQVIRGFLASEEYARVVNEILPSSVSLNFADPMRIDVQANESDLESLWRHILGVWSEFGREVPMWSVLTSERFRNPSPEAIVDFYNSGRGDVDYLIAFLRRAGIDFRQFKHVAEYGCGAGRTTKWLVEKFPYVTGFDISAPHLELARRHLTTAGNVSFVQVRERGDLAKLQSIDLFFSMIVLQHNPPPLILDVLDRAFAGLNIGGVAFFQVPSYGKGYRFNLAEYWQGEATKKHMEIHFVPQHMIYALADRHGLRLLETRQDHCIANYDRWISNTYLMQKTVEPCSR